MSLHSQGVFLQCPSVEPVLKPNKKKKCATGGDGGGKPKHPSILDKNSNTELVGEHKGNLAILPPLRRLVKYYCLYLLSILRGHPGVWKNYKAT